MYKRFKDSSGSLCYQFLKEDDIGSEDLLLRKKMGKGDVDCILQKSIETVLEHFKMMELNTERVVTRFREMLLKSNICRTFFVI